MISKYANRISAEVAAKLEVEMATALDSVSPGWGMTDVMSRCRLEKQSGIPFETLLFDDKPILEIHPIQMDRVETKNDSTSYRVTQNFRRLYAASSAQGQNDED